MQRLLITKVVLGSAFQGFPRSPLNVAACLHTSPTGLVRQWLTGFVRLYRPLIKELLVKRDKRLARRSDPVQSRQDRWLELLSLTTIDWAADLDALEAEVARRAIPA